MLFLECTVFLECEVALEGVVVLAGGVLISGGDARPMSAAQPDVDPFDSAPMTAMNITS